MAQPNWSTPAGSLGEFPTGVAVSYSLTCNPVSPALTVTYALISGTLPTGLSLSNSGVISGIPALVPTSTISTFTVRATDNLLSIRDRTFSITINSNVVPSITTEPGLLFNTNDSVWIAYQIEYDNPYPLNVVSMQIIQGFLPDGLEMNEQGLIRGYPEKPVDISNLTEVFSSSNTTSSIDDSITCPDTSQFLSGRPVVFTGITLGGIVPSQTYYVKDILSATKFTISQTLGGSVFALTTDTGSMNITLPDTVLELPSIRTYNFVVGLFSELGDDSVGYSITVINQNLPVVDGGPGYPLSTRIPVILNTRPLTYNIADDQYYGYYIVPYPETIPTTSNAPLGTFPVNNYFAFKMIGHDFDGDELVYTFSSLPLGLVGNTSTGWITGTPTLPTDDIQSFNFTVSVAKLIDPSIFSVNYNFNVIFEKNIPGTITWISTSNLGTISNGTISVFTVEALSDVPLVYEVINGMLPPNLSMSSTGNIIGKVAYQPTDTLLPVGTTTQFTFTVKAYNTDYPTIILSTKEFTITVVQVFDEPNDPLNRPTDTLYIKASPQLSDRRILETLLDNPLLIPNNYIYRPDDPNFGKASSVIYQHAYGINASSINEYLAAVQQNHYWRRITLGPIKTAVARNSLGEIIYEVVYSEVVDNLINPNGESIPEEIIWPRNIPLDLGAWFTSVLNVYTSYVSIDGQDYYTSLTPGTARYLYPNSLVNMRDRVGQELGIVLNTDLLPLWMISQQENGSSLGFIPAWVICYTKPGYSKTIANNINNNWPYTLNEINFEIDRFSVSKTSTYDYNNNVSPPVWAALPSAIPEPNPIDSKDFYVLFPRKTILPDQSQ